MSSQAKGQSADLRAVRGGAVHAAASGVPHAGLLVTFAEALVAHDDPHLAELRPRMIGAMGPDGFLEAALVAANFQRMVRIADSTGIPQDAPVRMLADDVIEDLSLRDFPSAANTPHSSPLLRLAGRVVRPLAPSILRLLAARMRRAARGGDTRTDGARRHP